MGLGKLFSAFLFSAILFQAQGFASDEINLDKDPLVGVSISKEQIAESLAKLKSEGKISEKDYFATQKELDKMSTGQVNALKEVALGMIRNDPDKALELVQAPKVNLEEAKRQINALSNPKSN